MIKKELNEIKRAITNPKETTLTEISLCYVSAEKEKVLMESIPFLNISEEETYKYFDIFKKALSGGFNKTLFHINMGDGEKERNLLAVMTEKDTKEAFYDEIIDKYMYPGNFLIIIGHGFYDYPGRFMDNALDKESDYTYEYMLTAICPVELSKPGLTVKDKTVTNRILDWVVGMPKDAFLYPTFTDRESNVHEMLYYSKNNKDTQEDLLNAFTGNDRPHSESEDKAYFTECTKNENDLDIPFTVAKEFCEQAKELIENSVDAVTKQPKEIISLLEDAGLSEKDAKNALEKYEKMVGERTEIPLENLVDTEKAVIKGDGFTLKTNANTLSEIKTLHIDGKTCLVMPLSSSFLEINGISTNAVH